MEIDLTPTEMKNSGPRQCRHCFEFLDFPESLKGVIDLLENPKAPQPWFPQSVCSQQICQEKEAVYVGRHDGNQRILQM